MIAKRTNNITFFLLLVIVIIFNFDVSLSDMKNENRKDKKNWFSFFFCPVFVIAALVNCLLRTLALFLLSSGKPQWLRDVVFLSLSLFLFLCSCSCSFSLTNNVRVPWWGVNRIYIYLLYAYRTIDGKVKVI
jgi:hypothetical protein